MFPGVWGGVSAASLLGLRLLAGRINFGTTTRASLPESKELTPRKGKAEKETGRLWAPQHPLITQNGISSNTSPPRLCLLEFGRKEPSEDFRMNRTHFSLEQCVGAICSEVCVGVRKARSGSPTSSSPMLAYCSGMSTPGPKVQTPMGQVAGRLEDLPLPSRAVVRSSIW